MKQLFFSLLSLLLCWASSEGQHIRKTDGSRYPADSLTLKVQDLMQKANVSGVALAVFNENEAVFKQTFGLAGVPDKKALQSHSVLYAASFAKMVFACIALQYVEEGVLELDKPLVEYLKKPLPAYKIKGWRRGYHDLKNDPRYEKITARMCLTHTTGFPNWRWLEADKKLKFRFDPGSRYSYSGEGLYLLQFVLEQITGKDYETLSQEKIFKPLGMRQTSQIWQARFDTAICYGHNAANEPYELMKWNEASAGGSMSTTLDDYVTFYQAFIQGRLLTAKSMQEMTSLQIRIRSGSQFGPLAAVDVSDNDTILLGYGLGVGVFQTPYGRAYFKEGHDDGWGHYSICFPDQQIALIVMTNNDNGESIFKELLAYAIGDTFTPWRWENYLPYELKR